MTDLKQECSKTLKALSPNLTPVDKLNATTETGYSRPTVEKYLKGDVIKIEVATDLIKFFSGVVNKRIKELRKATAA